MKDLGVRVDLGEGDLPTNGGRPTGEIAIRVLGEATRDEAASIRVSGS